MLLTCCALHSVPGRGQAQGKTPNVQEATQQEVLRLIRSFYIREVDLQALEADARARGVDSMVRSLDAESRLYSVSDLQAMRRDTVAPSPAARMLSDRIGYLAIVDLRQNTGTELSDAVAGLKRRGMKGVVLDLRGSPGGILSEAVAVCRLFFGGGKVVFRTTGRSQSAERTWTAEGKPAYPDLPLAVIVDGHTAAGSEIIAGALQDHHRAIIVGSKTAGKGSIESLWILPDGSALKLTTSTWVTPAGRGVMYSQGGSGGIVPDVELPELIARDSVLRTAVQILVTGRTRP